MEKGAAEQALGCVLFAEGLLANLAPSRDTRGDLTDNSMRDRRDK